MIPIDMARDATESGHLLSGRDRALWTVLYDADCGFCRWSLAKLLALDRSRRLRPLALGTPEADDLLADMPVQEREASWHLVSPEGWRRSAGSAAPVLLRLLPGGRLPAGALESAPEVTERTYRWVADHRSTFSRLISDRAKRRADQRIAEHTERAPCRD